MTLPVSCVMQKIPKFVSAVLLASTSMMASVKVDAQVAGKQTRTALLASFILSMT